MRMKRMGFPRVVRTTGTQASSINVSDIDKEFEGLYRLLDEKEADQFGIASHPIHGSIDVDIFDFGHHIVPDFRKKCFMLFAPRYSTVPIESKSKAIFEEEAGNFTRWLRAKQRYIKSGGLKQEGHIFEPGINKGNLAYEALSSQIARLLQRGELR